jgi:uncharacterized protein (TIGR03083 family)
MSVDLKTARVNPADYADKNRVLDVVRGARASFYDLIDRADDAGWKTPTACTEWETRDVVGHMVDVTESYLERWALARAGKPFPDALGTQNVMPKRADEQAKSFRSTPQRELIARLKRSSDQLFTIFDGLTADQWTKEMVPHVYMGPVPAFIYPGFQLMDYSVHGWDIRCGNGQATPLPEDEAGVLTWFMIYVLQPATVDPETAKGLDATWGVRVSGDYGGSWRATVKDGKLSYEEGSVAGLPVVFNFDPSDFVLTAFQRVQGGAAIGDQALASRVRQLWYRI